jgi:hypothetical protein
MSTVSLRRLDERQELREFLYHIRELLETHEKLAYLLKRLDAAYANDCDETAEVLSLLEVEIFDHLGYHRKQLRGPLSALLREAYSSAAGRGVERTTRHRRARRGR